MTHEVPEEPAEEPLTDEPPTANPDEVRWLASDDESAPPPWSALGAIAQLLAAVAAAVALVLALLALAGAASWLFR